MWIINSKTLDYGPKNVDYIIVNGIVRPKYVFSEVKMAGTVPTRNVHKPSYPSYVISWPIVTESAPAHGGTEALYKTLSELPLYKTITMHDGTYNLSFDIKIINRIIANLKTAKNGEILRSAQLTIVFITETGV